MPLILGSAFLAGALLSCVLPISLLIAFATYFIRSARRLPPNAAPGEAANPAEEQLPASTPHLTDV
jgi:hypothetical protein